jgi:hypothetical protein
MGSEHRETLADEFHHRTGESLPKREAFSLVEQHPKAAAALNVLGGSSSAASGDDETSDGRGAATREEDE